MRLHRGDVGKGSRSGWVLMMGSRLGVALQLNVPAVIVAISLFMLVT